MRKKLRRKQGADDVKQCIVRAYHDLNRALNYSHSIAALYDMKKREKLV